jgi:hypothetical protein
VTAEQGAAATGTERGTAPGIEQDAASGTEQRTATAPEQGATGTGQRSVSRTEQRWAPWMALAAAAAVASGLRLWAVGGVDVPLMWDEVGFIGNARHLAGTGPEATMTGAFYPVGPSLLLVPLVWLTSSATALHQAGVVLNVALLAALPFVLHGVLRRLGASTRASIAGAIAALALSSLTINAGKLWSETLLVVLLPCWLLAVGALRPGARRWSPVLVTSAGVALHATHGRGLAFVVASVVLVVAAPFVRRADAGAAAVAVAVAVVGVVVVRILNGAVADALYVGGGGGEAAALADRLRLDDVGSYLRTAVGQWWYALVASLGFVVAGAWVLLRTAWTGRRALWAAVPPVPAPDDDSDGGSEAGAEVDTDTETDGAGRADPLVAVAALGAVVWAAAISVAWIGTGIGRMQRGVVPAVRADLLVYGRYIDYVVVLLAAVGVAWLVDRPPSRERLAVAAATVAALGAGGLVVARGFPADWLGQYFNPSSSPALFGWIQQVGSFSPLRITALVAVIAAVALVVPARLALGAVAATIVVHVAVTTVVLDEYVEPFATQAREASNVPSEVNARDVSEVAILPPYSDGAFFKYQFWLEDARYELVDESDLGPGGPDLVIGPLDWDLADGLGATMVASDVSEDRALWELDR